MISVVIPAYNCRQFISKMVECVLCQTYGELEIIIVDDGSTDGTSELIDSLAMGDERIVVIHKQNGGVSSARNAGLDAARGEYISFVDADDTMAPDMYELLIRYMDEYKVKIAHCGYKRIDKNGTKAVNGTGRVYRQTRGEALECLIEGRLFSGSLWNKLYASELFKGIRFDTSIKINEDVLACYMAFRNAEDTVYIDEPKYEYRFRESGSSGTAQNIKRALDCEYVARIICDTEKDTALLKSAQRHLFSILKYKYWAYGYSNEPDKRVKCRSAADEMWDIYKRGAINDKKEGILIRLIKYTPFLYKPVYALYDKIRTPNLDVG